MTGNGIRKKGIKKGEERQLVKATQKKRNKEGGSGEEIKKRWRKIGKRDRKAKRLIRRKKKKKQEKKSNSCKLNA